MHQARYGNFIILRGAFMYSYWSKSETDTQKFPKHYPNIGHGYVALITWKYGVTVYGQYLGNVWAN